MSDEPLEGAIHDDKQFAVDLSLKLHEIGTREPNDEDRSVIMLCAGYIAGQANRIKTLEEVNQRLHAAIDGAYS